MPITRKQQILVKIESSEGVSAAPGSSDAQQIFDPVPPEDTVDVQRRKPAGPSLSSATAAIGRRTRRLTFTQDFRGSGNTSAPATEPDWGRQLKASGYQASGTTTLIRLTLGAVTGTGFQVGEIVTQSSGAIVGVCVGIMVSGSPVQRTTTSGAFVIIAVRTGTFTAAATTGASSGSTSTASAAAAYEGIGYTPTSQKLINATTGSWTGSAPAAVGEVVKIESPAGTVVGSCQVINNNGSMTNIDVTLLHGTISNGNTLRSAGNGTAVISAAPTMVKTPSVTIGHNLDGRYSELLGSRGTGTVGGEVGQPLQWKWDFSGDIGSSSDSLPVTTSGLSTISPPRILGAFLCYGVGAEIFRLPTKRISLDLGNTVNPNLDGNRAGGATGSNISDRNPQLTFTVDNVQSLVDWAALRDASTPVRVAWIVGTTAGNILTIVAPVGQVVDAKYTDSDGVSTWDVTVEPRRYAESGDDELYITQL